MDDKRRYEIGNLADDLGRAPMWAEFDGGQIFHFRMKTVAEGGKAIRELLAENRRLRKALARLATAGRRDMDFADPVRADEALRKAEAVLSAPSAPPRPGGDQG